MQLVLGERRDDPLLRRSAEQLAYVLPASFTSNVLAASSTV